MEISSAAGRELVAHTMVVITGVRENNHRDSILIRPRTNYNARRIEVTGTTVRGQTQERRGLLSMTTVKIVTLQIWIILVVDV